MCTCFISCVRVSFAFLLILSKVFLDHVCHNAFCNISKKTTSASTLSFDCRDRQVVNRTDDRVVYRTDRQLVHRADGQVIDRTDHRVVKRTDRRVIKS